MSETSSLPFDLDDDSLSRWLQSISSLSAVNAGSQLNQVINQLRRESDDYQLLLPLLLKLTPVTLHIANSLVSALTPGPQPEKTAKVAKLSLLLLRNLSLAFHAMLTADEISIEQKLQADFYALQLIGQYLRFSNLFHELPSETLWNISGELFFFAQQNNALHQSITCKISEFRFQPSIEQTIKRNLLFTISAFHQNSASDNQSLFSFANQYSNLLEFVSGQNKTYQFVWNYKNGVPRQSQLLGQRIIKSEIAIDTSNLLTHLKVGSFTPPLSQPELERVQHHLSGYGKLINDSIPSAPIILNLLSGLSPICDFLNKREKLSRIHKLSSQIKEEQPIRNMTLEPLDYEKNFFSSSRNVLETASSPVAIIVGQTIKLLKTTLNDFVIAEVRDNDYKTGDLAILINKTNALIPGIIKQQKSSSTTSSSYILIEKFLGDLASYPLQTELNNNGQVIVLNEDSDSVQVILPYGKYRNGTKIQFNGKTARLNALIDYSPFFVRYEVSF